MTILFSAGTVSATSGSKNISFSGAGIFPQHAKHGDEIRIDGGYAGFIDTINYVTQTATVSPEYSGQTGIGKPYSVRRSSAVSVAASEVLNQTYDLIARLSVFDANGVGLPFKFSVLQTNTPANGQIGVNNADPTLVTEIFLSHRDSKQKSTLAFVDSWQKYERILLRDVSDGSYAFYQATEKVEADDFKRSVSVRYLGHSGNLVDGAQLIVGYTTGFDHDFLLSQAELVELNAGITQASVAAVEAAKTAAETARTAAQTARTGAETAKTAAETARTKAQDWAEKAVDTTVETGAYSAKHHATKAAASASSAGTANTNAQSAKTAAETANTNAQSAKTAAETARTKAQDWAEKAVDTTVETGAYSAKHHATKAAASASTASTANTNAQSAKTAAESAKTASETARGAAQAAQTAAETARDGAQTARTGAETALTTTNSARDTAVTANTNAQSAKTAAETARTKAQEWAEKAVDTTVETGAYSAKHHATKAAASASTASTANTNAQSAKTAAESARDTAVTANTNAQSAKTAAEAAKTAAETAQGAAAGSATAAANSATTAGTARTGAEAARDAAATARDDAQAAVATVTMPATKVNAAFLRQKTDGTGLEYRTGAQVLSDIGASASSHTHSAATGAAAGFMSSADKAKLDGIAAGAQVNPATLADIAGTLPNAKFSGLYDGASLKLDGGNTVFSMPGTGSQSTMARTVLNLAEYKNMNTSVTGAIVFTAPNNTSTVMTQLELDVMNYVAGAGAPGKFIVTGYTTAGQWYFTSKICLGSFDIPIRWALNSAGRYSLIVGDVNTVWSYPHLLISQAMFSHVAPDEFCTGWTSSVITSLTGYSPITGPIASTLPNGVATAISAATGALTKASVGLGNVDNTTDVAKPVSTAQQTALNLKANLTSPAFTGTPTAPTQAGTDSSTRIATTAFVKAKFDELIGGADSAYDTFVEIQALMEADASGLASVITQLASKAPLASPAFTGTPTGITKAHVGLGNVDNTADSAKPVSTAQQTALNLKANLASPTFTGTVTMAGLTGTGNADFARFYGTNTDTAAAPSFTNASDLNTGIWFPAADQVGFTTGGANRVTISSTGLVCTGDVQAYSDIRLKSDVETIEGALDLVSQLRGVRYTMNGQRSVGVVAQEVQLVVPELVRTNDDEDHTLSMSYGNTVGLLIEAIKELKAEIEELKRVR